MLVPLLLLFSVGVGLPGFPAPAAPPDTVYTLPPVTVTAARHATTTAAAPVSVTVLDASAAVETTGARHVADLLRGEAGVFVKRYGPGGLASLSMRGFGASQTLLLLDGHRLTDPQLGQVDLTLLPALLPSTVEVARGPASALYGADGMGGVVHLRTAPAPAGTRARVLAEHGAFGEQRGSLSLAHGGALGAEARWSARLLAERYRAANDFPYLNTALFPPREVERTGAAVERTSLYGALGYQSPRREGRLAGWLAHADRGLPGLAAAAPQGETQEDASLRLWADVEERLGRVATLRVGADVQRSQLRYQHPGLGIDDTGRTWTSTLDVSLQRLLGLRSLATVGASGSLGRARHPSLADDARERRGALYADATLALGRLLVYPALRLDVLQSVPGPTRTALSPRLGLNLQPTAFDGFRLKARAGRAFRAPTFNDRFWQPGGNPALRPERSWTFDGGAWLQRDIRLDAVGLQQLRAGGELTGFVAWSRDQIVWQPTSAGFWSPRNVARVRTRGLEAVLHAGLDVTRAIGLEGRLTATRTDARDRSDPAAAAYDQPLRYVPPRQVAWTLAARLGPLRLHLERRYTGRRYLTTDGRQALSPFWMLDGHATVRLAHPWGHATLGFDVLNLADERVAIVAGYPLPPRHLRARLLIEMQP